MRFTERYDDIFATTKDGKETHEKGVRIKDKVGGFEKFAKLEDIEEDLGIDLFTLFKALKIIKKKKADIKDLINEFAWSDGLTSYNERTNHIALTQEEYDLLKKVLKNE